MGRWPSGPVCGYFFFKYPSNRVALQCGLPSRVWFLAYLIIRFCPEFEGWSPSVVGNPKRVDVKGQGFDPNAWNLFVSIKPRVRVLYLRISLWWLGDVNPSQGMKIWHHVKISKAIKSTKISSACHPNPLTKLFGVGVKEGARGMPEDISTNRIPSTSNSPFFKQHWRSKSPTCHLPYFHYALIASMLLCWYLLFRVHRDRRTMLDGSVQPAAAAVLT